jgi:hypothetical protein
MISFYAIQTDTCIIQTILKKAAKAVSPQTAAAKNYFIASAH